MELPVLTSHVKPAPFIPFSTRSTRIRSVPGGPITDTATGRRSSLSVTMESYAISPTMILLGSLSKLGYWFLLTWCRYFRCSRNRRHIKCSISAQQTIWPWTFRQYPGPFKERNHLQQLSITVTWLPSFNWEDHNCDGVLVIGFDYVF